MNIEPGSSKGNDPIIASDFEAAVLATIAAIPAGRVLAYGEVARRAGFPGYARHVGTLLSRQEETTGIPWHRVLRADGSLAFAAGSTRFREQRQRLLAEGVRFRGARVRGEFFAT